MRLVDAIEECSLIHYLPDPVVWEIVKIYPADHIDHLIQTFLKGIGSRHQVPGKIVHVLSDISWKYQEHGVMTRDQKIRVIHEIIAYWQQMNSQSRAELML